MWGVFCENLLRREQPYYFDALGSPQITFPTRSFDVLMGAVAKFCIAPTGQITPGDNPVAEVPGDYEGGL